MNWENIQQINFFNLHMNAAPNRGWQVITLNSFIILCVFFDFMT